MTHYDAILNHIKADAPCSLGHVTGWAVSQGFGGTKLTVALADMLKNNIITIDSEDDHTVELIGE
jgi:hypothetical protein